MLAALIGRDEEQANIQESVKSRRGGMVVLLIFAAFGLRHALAGRRGWIPY
jgi:hypothetical protein